MAYMLLIMEPGQQRRERSLDEGRAAYAQMLRFGEDLHKRGLLLGADALSSDAKAVRVTTRGGRPSIIDGPFAEAKEIVGGYFLIDCKSREEAVAIAQTCPAAAWATVEVREIAPCYDGSG
jgi:hypothetical protein